MLVKFSLFSLSYIVVFTSAYSASSVITWVSVSCSWFSEAPHPWEAAIVFFADMLAPVCLIKLILEGLPVILANLHIFPLLTGFFHTPNSEDK